jgi:hypothetical protein
VRRREGGGVGMKWVGSVLPPDRRFSQVPKGCV